MTDPSDPRPSPSGGGRFSMVVLDFDGTLADTFDWFAGVLNGVAERYRFRRVEAHEREALRGLDARAVMASLGIPRWKVPFIARHMHRLAARDAHAFALFPGIPEMLARIEAAGLAIAVVSSNTEANVRRVLGPEAARVRRYACGASVFGKADKFRAVMRAEGLAAARVLAIGDEIRDREAALAAGCAFAAVAWGYTRPEALAASGSERVFGTPLEIAAFLEGERRDAYMPRPAPGTGEPAPALKGS